MLNINIICVGKVKEKFFADSINEYSKRLSKYCKLDIIEVADEKLPSKINNSIINEIKNKEATKIISKLKKDSYIISLDLTGQNFSSEEFSKNEKLCFSKMTFPHQLIRVFLLEQLFRAFKISNNETYHW